MSMIGTDLQRRMDGTQSYPARDHQEGINLVPIQSKLWPCIRNKETDRQTA